MNKAAFAGLVGLGVAGLQINMNECVKGCPLCLRTRHGGVVAVTILMAHEPLIKARELTANVVELGLSVVVGVTVKVERPPHKLAELSPKIHDLVTVDIWEERHA